MINKLKTIFWILVACGALIIIPFVAFITKMDYLGDDYE